MKRRKRRQASLSPTKAMTILNIRLGKQTLSAGVTNTWLRIGAMMMYNEDKGFTLISRLGPMFLYITKEEIDGAY